MYGRYENPYLKGRINPHMVDMTKNGQNIGHDEKLPNPVEFTIDFSRLGSHLNFNNVSIPDDNLSIEQPSSDKNQQINTEGKNFFWLL